MPASKRSCHLALVATLLLAPDLAAQAPQVYYACHVPLTGTLYRIKESGIKPACTAPTHVEFNWTDGLGAIRPTTPAAGDLSGSFAAPMVARLLGRPLSVTAPTNGQVLQWNGTEWTPSTPAAAGASDHGALTGLTDDDHAQYLLASGVRPSTGFAVVGSTAPIPASGAGSRLMYYPAKDAFRAGRVNGTQWDAVNVGEFSAALGLNTTASNSGTFAVGAGTTASGIYSFAAGDHATASGGASLAVGASTQASGVYSVALGLATEASGWGAVASGDNAVASGRNAFAHGFLAEASGDNSTSIGYKTEATRDYAIAFGFQATATANSAVSIGTNVIANGIRSVVLGNCASNPGYQGAFVFSDNMRPSCLGDSDVMKAEAHNEFAVRASGGFRLRTGTSNGCNLAPGGGSWVCTSSAATKTDFNDIDGEFVLGQIARMPIRSWQYTDEPGAIRHVGPTAEDFRAAFGLGDTDKAIGHIDADGINMRAIQALELRTREVAILKSQLAETNARLAQLEEIVAALRKH